MRLKHSTDLKHSTEAKSLPYKLNEFSAVGKADNLAE